MALRLLATVLILLLGACQPTAISSSADTSPGAARAVEDGSSRAERLPCLQTSRGTDFSDTKTGRWLLGVLRSAGAPGGHAISRQSVKEEFGEFVIDIPAYQGRFHLSVFAEPPDFRNIALGKIPVIARSADHSLHGSSIKAKTRFQQFIAAGKHVWVPVRVRPDPHQISENDMRKWFRRYVQALDKHPVPRCLRRSSRDT